MRGATEASQASAIARFREEEKEEEEISTLSQQTWNLSRTRGIYHHNTTYKTDT
jgi:hypothetical protein